MSHQVHHGQSMLRVSVRMWVYNTDVNNLLRTGVYVTSLLEIDDVFVYFENYIRRCAMQNMQNMCKMYAKFM